MLNPVTLATLSSSLERASPNRCFPNRLVGSEAPIVPRPCRRFDDGHCDAAEPLPAGFIVERDLLLDSLEPLEQFVAVGGRRHSVTVESLVDAVSRKVRRNRVAEGGIVQVDLVATIVLRGDGRVDERSSPLDRVLAPPGEAAVDRDAGDPGLAVGVERAEVRCDTGSCGRGIDC